jgi:hypothetical protein
MTDNLKAKLLSMDVPISLSLSLSIYGHIDFAYLSKRSQGKHHGNI